MSSGRADARHPPGGTTSPADLSHALIERGGRADGLAVARFHFVLDGSEPLHRLTLQPLAPVVLSLGRLRLVVALRLVADGRLRLRDLLMGVPVRLLDVVLLLVGADVVVRQ